MSHKHCKHCGLDFEPAQSWTEYCSPKCIEDYQKLHPVQFQNQFQIQVPPGWVFPSTGTAEVTYWYCGICGRNIPANESHVHTFAFPAGSP